MKIIDNYYIIFSILVLSFHILSCSEKASEKNDKLDEKNNT